jgi:hypothetical protein
MAARAGEAGVETARASALHGQPATWRACAAERPEGRGPDRVILRPAGSVMTKLSAEESAAIEAAVARQSWGVDHLSRTGFLVHDP